MSHLLINEYVDIDQCPMAQPVDKDCRISIGDLHGNAVLYLFMLMKHGVVKRDPAKYKRFVEIYKKPTNDLTKEELAEIRNIVKSLEVINKPFICFIGDKYADRGQNDYFTLLLDEKLDQEKVPHEDLKSNHDHLLIEAYEQNKPFRSHRSTGNRQFAGSMHNMQDLIEAGKLEGSEVNRLIKNCYMPYTKLLSCIVDSDDEITLFHHAKIDEEVICFLAAQLNVEFKAETVHELAATIEKINRVYQEEYVKKGISYTLPKDFDSFAKSDPVTFLMWNRNYMILKANKRNYKVNHVHGHDSEGPAMNGVYCLDGPLGKSMNLHRNYYRALLTTPGLANELEKTETKELVVNPSPRASVTPIPAQVFAPAPRIPIVIPQVFPIDFSPPVPKAKYKILGKKAQDDFLAQLEEIKLLKNRLNTKARTDFNYLKAAHLSRDLYKNINNAYQTFDKDQNALSYETFRKSVLKEIKTAAPALEKHRGWKQVIAYTLLALSGIGLLYLAAEGIHYAATGRLWFFRTNSAEKLDEIKNNIKTILPKPELQL